MAQRPYPGAPRFQPFQPPSVSRLPAPQIGRVSAPGLQFMPLGKGGDVLTQAIEQAIASFMGEAAGQGLETGVDWAVDSLGGYKEQPAPSSEYQPDTRRSLLAQGDLGRRYDPRAEQQAGIGIPEVRQGFEQEAARIEGQNQQAFQTVVQAAQEAGVDPRLLLSIWQQEGSASTDPKMRGPVLPEGHKYAGHYGIGPFQIMSFHENVPKDFAGQARWAAQHLKERGVRGYYGETKGNGSGGVTGLPEMPSTDQYEAQVLARAQGMGYPQAPSSGGRGMIPPGETQVAQGSPLSPQSASPSPGGGAPIPGVLPEREYGALGKLFGTQARYDKKREKSQRNALAELGIKRQSLGLANELAAWEDEQKYLDSLTPAERDDFRAAKYQDPQARARQEERYARERQRIGAEPSRLVDGKQWNPQTRSYEAVPGLDQGPPQQRVVTSGDQQITQEYRDGQWVDVATAPRWAPEAPPQTELTLPQKMSQANTWYNDFRKGVAVPAERLDRWNLIKDYKAEEVLKDPAQQRALIVSYAKFLDPNSAVMENEADAIAYAAQRFPSFEKIWRDHVNNSLDKDAIESMLRESKQMAGKAQKQWNQTYKDFEERGKRYGVNPMDYLPSNRPEGPLDIGGGFILP